MSLKLYSKYCVDVIFGEGAYGFILGKTDEDFPVVKGCSKKEDGSLSALEGCGAITKGDYIVAIDGKNVAMEDTKFVKALLKKASRPVTIRFGKPCSKSHWKTIRGEDGEKRTQKWGDGDLYLPIRCYDLTGLGDQAIVQRQCESMETYSLTPIYPDGAIFESEVRESAFNGVSSQKARSHIWKMLLRSYPYQPSKWEEAKEKNFEMYQTFVNEFVVTKNKECGKESCEIIPNPIDSSWKRSEDYNPTEDDGVSNESKWSRDFGDSEMREIIWKDTERTYSDVEFFNTHNKNVLARLLFVFGKLNSGIQYVQGMNELLAPLLYVFAESENEQMDSEVNRHVEADTFFAFNNLMSETRDLFIKQMDSTSSGLRGVLLDLHSYLERHIPECAEHLASLEVDPQFYAVRWLTTLFAREYPLKDTFRIWDSLLADPERFMFMHCIGTSMIEHVKDKLLESDFAGIISFLLQSYEAPQVEEILEKANVIRLNELKMQNGFVEEGKKKKGKKNNTKKTSEIAGDVTDSVKKGWDLMKNKGLPFLTRIAQETKTKVVTLSKDVGSTVNQKMKPRKDVKEEESSEEESSGEEKKSKKHAKKLEKKLEKHSKKEKKREKESKEPEEVEEDNEVAYL